MTDHTDDLRSEVAVALAIAYRVDPSWRHQLLDLLRSASAALDDMLDAGVYAKHYAWGEVRDAARTACSNGPEVIDDARIVYVYALCRQVLRFVRDRPSDAGE